MQPDRWGSGAEGLGSEFWEAGAWTPDTGAAEAVRGYPGYWGTAARGTEAQRRLSRAHRMSGRLRAGLRKPQQVRSRRSGSLERSTLSEAEISGARSSLGRGIVGLREFQTPPQRGCNLKRAAAWIQTAHTPRQQTAQTPSRNLSQFQLVLQQEASAVRKFPTSAKDASSASNHQSHQRQIPSTSTGANFRRNRLARQLFAEVASCSGQYRYREYMLRAVDQSPWHVQSQSVASLQSSLQ